MTNFKICNNIMQEETLRAEKIDEEGRLVVLTVNKNNNSLVVIENTFYKEEEVSSHLRDSLVLRDQRAKTINKIKIKTIEEALAILDR